jgi:hypothetical protein
MGKIMLSFFLNDQCDQFQRAAESALSKKAWESASLVKFPGSSKTDRGDCGAIIITGGIQPLNNCDTGELSPSIYHINYMQIRDVVYIFENFS